MKTKAFGIILVLQSFVLSFGLQAQCPNRILQLKVIETEANALTIAWQFNGNDPLEWEISINNQSPVTVDDSVLENLENYKNLGDLTNVKILRVNEDSTGNNLLAGTSYHITVTPGGCSTGGRSITGTTAPEESGVSNTTNYGVNYPKSNSFSPQPGHQYIVSGWVKESTGPVQSYENTGIQIIIKDNNDVIQFKKLIKPSQDIIDGWQRISGNFRVPASLETPSTIFIELINESDTNAYFDDIRIFPVNGNLKSFVYDPKTKKLLAELDENNYATYYEYDNEGGLVRVKKETERGVFTIKETRSHTSKKSD